MEKIPSGAGRHASGHHVFLHFVETVTTMLLRLGLVGLGDVEFSVGKDDIFR